MSDKERIAFSGFLFGVATMLVGAALFWHYPDPAWLAIIPGIVSTLLYWWE